MLFYFSIQAIKNHLAFEMVSEVELRGIEPLYPNVEYGFLTVR